MKFTVDISDEWIEENELSESVREAIIRKLSHDIKAMVIEKIDKEVKTAVLDFVEAEMKGIISGHLSEFVEEGVLIRDGKQVPTHDYLRAIFSSHSGWNNPDEVIASLAKKFGTELKARYDAAFANQIVVKMHENGFLKDDVVRLLLAGK